MTKLLLRAFPMLCSIAAAALTTPAAHSAEPTVPLADGADLVSACQAEQQASDSGNRLCEGYVFGYLHGNPKVIYTGELPSSYMQRVLRTRAPSHPQTKSLKSAIYCLEKVDDLSAIQASIAALDLKAAANVMPYGVIDQILEQQYRCRQ